MHINVTIADLAQAGFGEALVDMLATLGLPPRRLALDVDPAAVEQDLGDEVTRAVSLLHAAGVGLVFDNPDDGAEAASVASPLAKLKFDRMVTGGTRSDSLGGGKRQATVAKGIETEAQLAAVHALGVRYGQGYLLGRPGPLPGTAELPTEQPPVSLAA